MAENSAKEINGFGSVRIADDVVAIIAGIAATEVSGVAGMSGGIAGGITEILGKKNLSKGVKVKIEEKETFIDLYMIVNYGVKIHEVSREVQDKVKQAVSNMTGLNIGFINIHIQGIKFGEEQISEEKQPEEEISE